MFGRAHRAVDRRGTDSEKWQKYAGRDVLPLWVADMDMPMPSFVLAALRRRAAEPILGYAVPPAGLAERFIDWLRWRYGWSARAEWLVWLTGVVPGFTLAARALAERGRNLVLPVPAYPPMLQVAERAGLQPLPSPLVRRGQRWELDFDDLCAKITRRAAAVLFCNPHNPTGRVFDEAELRALAALVVSADCVIVSDEIHCPLVLDADRRHIPIASLDGAVAARSITLFSPTKAYNFAGLGGAVAVIPNAAIREPFAAAIKGMASNVSPLAYAAMGAAFADRGRWLARRNAVLARNGAQLEAALAALDGVRSTHVEGTFMAWLDVTALGLTAPAAAFEAGGLGLSDGAEFGAPGFLRWNFGCGRGVLATGLARLRRTVGELAAGRGAVGSRPSRPA